MTRCCFDYRWEEPKKGITLKQIIYSVLIILFLWNTYICAVDVIKDIARGTFFKDDDGYSERNMKITKELYES